MNGFNFFRENPMTKFVREQQAWKRQLIGLARSPFKEVFEEHRKMRENSFKPFFEVNKVAEALRRWSEGIEDTKEDMITFKKAMVDLGYPPNDWIDIRKLRQIAQDYSENGKEHVAEYIDEFMVKFYDEKMLETIRANWNEKSYLKNRLPLLRNAIMAHKLGMYDLVVPAVLSQLEGLIIDSFEIKGFVNEDIQLILLEHLLLKNKEITHSFDYDDAIYEYYSTNILVSFKHGSFIKSDVSRHAILHGGYTNFGKETSSLKVLLLIDYLIDAIEDLREKTIKLAKEEVRIYRKLRYQRQNRRKRNR
ncbi:hypothetical protein ACH0BF_02085 [Pseudobacillus sp. 179-B 2D1 NHS]|uniref:hypothetical protein n=1 Tax=Pseudobacillus sp. 179-B 2D1 NHS TaxID=3374292 RepID=UPI00387A2DE5